MAKLVGEPVSTISLVLTVAQIQYINDQAKERGESKGAIGRDLVKKGIEVTKAKPPVNNGLTRKTRQPVSS